jgi:hypothetical protein
MATAETPDIRGQERVDLIEALALGAETHVQLAERFGRSPDAIHQFSSRNGDEIGRRKAVLHDELTANSAHLWVTEKAEILAYYQQMLDTLRLKVSASEADDRVQSRAVRNAQKLLHDCSELEGLLQARSRVEMEVSGAELPPVGTRSIQTTDVADS